jgi:hypothetical protein
MLIPMNPSRRCFLIYFKLRRPELLLNLKTHTTPESGQIHVRS